MEYRDYYRIMDVGRRATPEDIKHAHRKLARKYHPDVSSEQNAEARFKELSEAYEVLRDRERRAAYDQFCAHWHASQNSRPQPGVYPRTNAWSAGRRDQPRQDPKTASPDAHFASADTTPRARPTTTGQPTPNGVDTRGQDKHTRIQISIEESYAGSTRTLRLRTPESGPHGRIVIQERTIEFVIPRGIRAGQQIRLAGQGGDGHGKGAGGDLYLDVEFSYHPQYRAEGHDVYVNLPVTQWEAAHGAEIEAPTPTGRVRIKIPPGSAAGRKLRLKGRGLPSQTAGDLYFVLEMIGQTETPAPAKKPYFDIAGLFRLFRPRASVKSTQAEV
jgi:curved DNA-binding protein